MLAAVRQVGEDARKLAQMLATPEGRCLAVNHRTFDGKAVVGGDNLANYDAAMAGRCRTLSTPKRSSPTSAETLDCNNGGRSLQTLRMRRC